MYFFVAEETMLLFSWFNILFNVHNESSNCELIGVVFSIRLNPRGGGWGSIPNLKKQLKNRCMKICDYIKLFYYPQPPTPNH